MDNSSIKYQFISKRTDKRRAKVAEFYNRYFPEESNKIIAQNSSVFWIAKKKDEIVGVTRMLTDYSRYALLLDLIVRKAERNQGIGKHLVTLAKDFCKKQNIKHLILTTDSRYKWLTNFYKKSGFKVIKDQDLMEFES